MPSSNSLLVTSSFLILFISLFASLPLAANITNPTALVSSSSICQNTPDPSYCKSVLSNQNASTIYDFGRISVRKSLSQARKFQTTIENYLNKRSSLSSLMVRALEDCSVLAGLNMDLLLTSLQTLDKTSSLLSPLKADDVQTFMSAILTNQQTCMDGMQAVKNGLSIPLQNDTKLNSVSLALFTKGWVPKGMKGSGGRTPTSGRKSGFENGRMTMKMSKEASEVYEAARGRKLAEEGDGVLVSKAVTVSQDGSGNYTTINDAIAAAPNNSAAANGYFMIYVKAGVYEEYVSVAKNKRYLMMVGDGINRTILTGNRSVVDGWTTFNSATFAVVAPGFVAVNMTFSNTAGAAKHQAVAVRNGADLSTFYNCSFEAYQDTLYTHSLRQFYRECDIYGTVDFIFGNAAVVFQNCNIFPRLPMTGQFNAITAQGRTDPNQNTGTSIHNCTIRAADDLASGGGAAQTYLGRPWKEYSRTVFMQCDIDDVVNAAGWKAWDGEFALTSLYYGEYDNRGAGSDTTKRVTWDGFHVITEASDASNFTVSNFLLGENWLPQTGVPYTGGLI